MLQAAASERAANDPFPVAITFDDDLPSHRIAAAPILEALGAPAAFFVGGGSFDHPRVYWWDRLQAIADRDLIDAPLVALVLGPSSDVQPGRAALKPLARAIEAMGPDDRREIEEWLEGRAGPPSRSTGMTPREVRELADGGFEIGFHTVEHSLLTALPDAELRDALVTGRDRVADASGREVDVLSYPHGKADGRVAACAAACGYRLAFTGTPRAVQPSSDPYLLGRLEPSFGSVAELAAQLNGLLGSARAER